MNTYLTGPIDAVYELRVNARIDELARENGLMIGADFPWQERMRYLCAAITAKVHRSSFAEGYDTCLVMEKLSS